jgi:hypothetical protein
LELLPLELSVLKLLPLELSPLELLGMELLAFGQWFLLASELLALEQVISSALQLSAWICSGSVSFCVASVLNLVMPPIWDQWVPPVLDQWCHRPAVPSASGAIGFGPVALSVLEQWVLSTLKLFIVTVGVGAASVGAMGDAGVGSVSVGAVGAVCAEVVGAVGAGAVSVGAVSLVGVFCYCPLSLAPLLRFSP